MCLDVRGGKAEGYESVAQSCFPSKRFSWTENNNSNGLRGVMRAMFETANLKPSSP